MVVLIYTAFDVEQFKFLFNVIAKKEYFDKEKTKCGIRIEGGFLSVNQRVTLIFAKDVKINSVEKVGKFMG